MNKISTKTIRELDSSLTEEMAATILHNLELLLPSKIGNAKEYKEFCKTGRHAIWYESQILYDRLKTMLKEAEYENCSSYAVSDSKDDVFCAIVSRVDEKDNKWLEIQIESALLREDGFDGEYTFSSSHAAWKILQVLGKRMDELDN